MRATPRQVLRATAVWLAMGLLGTSSVWALTLGALSVRSTVGQPLNATVEVLRISAEEAATLQLRLMSEAEYRSAGIEWDAALQTARVMLEGSSSRGYSIRVMTARPVQQPFLDVLLQAQWTGGQLRREYTVLLEPTPSPGANASNAAVSQAPTVASGSKVSPGAASSAPSSAASAAASAAAAADSSSLNGPQRRRVKAALGDTLTAIALREKPVGVSLDQMLVALYEANPKAFADNNMNRLIAGRPLSIPLSPETAAVEAARARLTVEAHTVDFERYRQKLAERVPTVSERAASLGPAALGRAVTARVTETSKRTATSAAASAPVDRVSMVAPVVQTTVASARAVDPSASVAEAVQPLDPKQLAAREAALARSREAFQALQASQVASSASGALAKAAKATPWLSQVLESPLLLPLAALLLALLVGVGLFAGRSSWQRQRGQGV